MVGGPTDPPMRSLNRTVRFTVRDKVPGAGITNVYTPQALAALLPFAGANVRALRITRIHMYGPDATTTPGDIQIVFPSPSLTSWWSNGNVFSDKGVVGSRRAAIHVTVPKQLSLMWWADSDATNLLFSAYNSDATAANAATVEVEATFVTGPSTQ